MGFRKILVLDDSRFNRDMLKDILTDAGFDAETTDTFDAFEKALMWWNPDAIVVDVHMPGKSGPETVTHVRASVAKRIPIVLMSAMMRPALATLAVECGADDCFSTLDGLKGVVGVLHALKAKIDAVPDDSPGW